MILCDIKKNVDIFSSLKFVQEDLEKECPDIMKLGLLHVVGVRKATARKEPAFLSYEHKSLQEFGASKFVTKRLETAENMKVSLSDNNPTCTYPESEDS